MLFRSVSALAVAAFLAAVSLSAQAAPSTSHEPVSGGRLLSDWIADLKAPAPATRNAAAYEIAGMGPAAAAAVPALIEALADEVPAVRFPVTVALAEIGPAASAAIPRLRQVMDEDFDDDLVACATTGAVNGEIAAAARRAIKRIEPRALAQE